MVQVTTCGAGQGGRPTSIKVNENKYFTTIPGVATTPPPPSPLPVPPSLAKLHEATRLPPLPRTNE